MFYIAQSVRFYIISYLFLCLTSKNCLLFTMAISIGVVDVIGPPVSLTKSRNNLMNAASKISKV